MLCKFEECDAPLKSTNKQGYCRKHRHKAESEKARNSKALKDRTKAKQEFVNEIKLSSGCVDCGYNDNPIALDFDHIGTDKVASISQMILVGNRSIESILQEIQKCEVVCANCHRIRTSKRRELLYGPISKTR